MLSPSENPGPALPERLLSLTRPGVLVTTQTVGALAVTGRCSRYLPRPAGPDSGPSLRLRVAGESPLDKKPCPSTVRDNRGRRHTGPGPGAGLLVLASGLAVVTVGHCVMGTQPPTVTVPGRSALRLSHSSTRSVTGPPRARPPLSRPERTRLNMISTVCLTDLS